MDFTETRITSTNSGVLLHVCSLGRTSFAFNLEDLDPKLLRAIVISHGACYNETTPMMKNFIEQISYAIHGDEISIADKNKIHKGQLIKYQCDLPSLGRLGIYKVRRIFLVCH